MLKNPKVWISASLLISSLLFASSALAVESTKSATSLKKCDATTQRIDKRIEQYNKNKDTHLMKYKNMQERFLTLADRLDKKGYNTTQLRTDGKTLDAKIKKSTDDYASFITKLEATKQYTCGASQGQFKTSLEAARAQLKIFRSDVQDVRSFYKLTVKTDLQALKNQKVKASSSPKAN